jgi:hypothetical protein
LSSDSSTIFVFTDTPGFYGEDFSRGNMIPIFVKESGILIEKLKLVDMAGLILELPKVMAAPRKDRDRLFNYAKTFPVLRTKINPRHGFVAYLDSKECFFNNLDAAIGKRCRNHDRIPVKLDCSFSAEKDPVMSEGVEGRILDISPAGCFVHTKSAMLDESFIHLHIPDLENSRPIFSSIRWARARKLDDLLPGMGIMFIDLSDDQLENILSIQLAAQTS